MGGPGWKRKGIWHRLSSFLGEYNGCNRSYGCVVHDTLLPASVFGCTSLVLAASLDFGWTHHWKHYWTASGGLPAGSFHPTRCDWNSSFRRYWRRASGGKGVNDLVVRRQVGGIFMGIFHPTRMQSWQMECFLGISYTKNMMISYMTR